MVGILEFFFFFRSLLPLLDAGPFLSSLIMEIMTQVYLYNALLSYKLNIKEITFMDVKLC